MLKLLTYNHLQNTPQIYLNRDLLAVRIEKITAMPSGLGILNKDFNDIMIF